MKLRFTPRAAQDIAEIADYIRGRNPAAAVRVRDDTVAVSAEDFWSTDACEVIVEGPHRGQQLPSWSTASDSPALVYVMWPPGGSYGPDLKSPDILANPNLMGGDISGTRTRGAYRREGDVSIYGPSQRKSRTNSHLERQAPGGFAFGAVLARQRRTAGIRGASGPVSTGPDPAARPARAAPRLTGGVRAGAGQSARDGRPAEGG